MPRGYGNKYTCDVSELGHQCTAVDKIGDMKAPPCVFGEGPERSMEFGTCFGVNLQDLEHYSANSRIL